MEFTNATLIWPRFSAENWSTSDFLSLFYHFSLFFSLAFVASLFLLWVKTKPPAILDAKRTLLVIAHPDDECMFFGPTILSVLKTSKLYLVCLSDGNYYGKGEVRKNELWESCAALGINPNHLFLYKHDLLFDDPLEDWNPKLIAGIISNQIETLDIDVVISFDRGGVSGHKNHIAIYNAFQYLKTNDLFPANCRCYVLDSVTFFRKFFGVVNIVFDIFAANLLTCSFDEQNTVKTAMRMHKSQNLWFRKLFMVFSRYTYINTLTRTS